MCVPYLEREVSGRRHDPGLEPRLDGPDSIPDDLELGLVTSLIKGHFPVVGVVAGAAGAAVLLASASVEEGTEEEEEEEEEEEGVEVVLVVAV